MLSYVNQLTPTNSRPPPSTSSTKPLAYRVPSRAEGDACGDSNLLNGVEGTSAKFWQAESSGTTFIVEFGRLGTKGQRKEKDFPNEDAAKKELAKKIAEKLREGYSEVATTGADSAVPPEPKVHKLPQPSSNCRRVLPS